MTSAILVRRDNSARSPKALEGQRVGVAGGYTTTTGLWARALLQEEHGVDLGRVTWVLSGDEHVAEYRAPANVVSAGGRKLVDLLLEGEIDALIGTGVDHPAVVPLVPDGLAAGLQALRKRGYYPINHLVVVRDELLDETPQLAGAPGPAHRLRAAHARRGARVVVRCDDAHPRRVAAAQRCFGSKRTSGSFTTLDAEPFCRVNSTSSPGCLPSSAL